MTDELLAGERYLKTNVNSYDCDHSAYISTDTSFSLCTINIKYNNSSMKNPDQPALILMFSAWNLPLVPVIWYLYLCSTKSMNGNNPE